MQLAPGRGDLDEQPALVHLAFAPDSQPLIDQAIDIIRQRVNGSGVAEAEITRQGSGSNATIVVSVPGKDQGELLDKVNQTAQLTFRPVLQEGAGVAATPTPSASTTTSPTPSTSASPSCSRRR